LKLDGGVELFLAGQPSESGVDEAEFSIGRAAYLRADAEWSPLLRRNSKREVNIMEKQYLQDL